MTLFFLTCSWRNGFLVTFFAFFLWWDLLGPDLGRQNPPLHFERYGRVQKSRNGPLLVRFELFRKRFRINVPLGDGQDFSVVRLVNIRDLGVPQVSFGGRPGRISGPCPRRFRSEIGPARLLSMTKLPTIRTKSVTAQIRAATAGPMPRFPALGAGSNMIDLARRLILLHQQG